MWWVLSLGCLEREWAPTDSTCLSVPSKFQPPRRKAADKSKGKGKVPAATARIKRTSTASSAGRGSWKEPKIEDTTDLDYDSVAAAAGNDSDESLEADMLVEAIRVCRSSLSSRVSTRSD